MNAVIIQNYCKENKIKLIHTTTDGFIGWFYATRVRQQIKNKKINYVKYKFKKAFSFNLIDKNVCFNKELKNYCDKTFIDIDTGILYDKSNFKILGHHN